MTIITFFWYSIDTSAISVRIPGRFLSLLTLNLAMAASCESPRVASSRPTSAVPTAGCVNCTAYRLSRCSTEPLWLSHNTAAPRHLGSLRFRTAARTICSQHVYPLPVHRKCTSVTLPAAFGLRRVCDIALHCLDARPCSQLRRWPNRAHLSALTTASSPCQHCLERSVILAKPRLPRR